MTDQPARTSTYKRILYTIIAFVTVIGLFIGFKIYHHIQAQNVTQSMIAAAVRANFPDFCTDGQILAASISYDRPILLTDFDNQWGIKCDTWLKNPMGFYGDVTIIDVDRCTTIRPIVGTVGEYYFQFESINKSNGKKLAVCPQQN
ncbi:MAG: hypothetical protein ABI690_04915 [Chloroflexota bacterium]